MAYIATAGSGVGYLYGGYPLRRSADSRTLLRQRRNTGPLGVGATTPAAIVGQVGGAAGGVVTAAAAPAVATALGLSVSIAVPLVGLAFAGVLMGVEAILNSGCGQTCVVTSQWANQAEPLLQQNIQQYFSIANRTQADQQSALNVFDAVWSGLTQRCSQPGLGTAGQNCIADRQRGACKWHATSNSPWPGGPAAGACWNWFNAYRDPIANDTNVGPGSLGGSLISSLASVNSALPLALIAGLVILGVALG